MEVCSKLVAMALGLVLAVALVAGPTEARMLERVHFGMLPKAFVPPSGPSWRYSYSPPPPALRQRLLHFGMLPKGVIPRPSGPSTKSNIPPPSPSHY
ncbi:hypothetical protein RHGRI_011637 [Rhododendron griersonianum]|uniref:Uncharacterized protein n=1 Tax=Rhododendron griersonianum TaxID=479676 RepID=A0AAV6KMK6_9ERIC|nr:hypothetical protein RHGRI_011637 [Rhododendron griersonianum]